MVCKDAGGCCQGMQTLAALETKKEGKNARMEGLVHAMEKPAEEATNIAQNVCQAAQALGDLGIAVYALQNANKVAHK